MNTKLFLGALLFSIITTNAQVTTINENFDSFTAGNTTFPQNGWSAVLAANPLPYPPAPMMIVAGTTDKYIQAYSGNSTSNPSYLVSPQIVAPTGDKTLSFSALKNSTSPADGTIEIGLASDPSDMATFVAIGSPIALSNTTAQTFTVNVPASTSTYIVFKFTPMAAHVALELDNVVYTTTVTLGTSEIKNNAAGIKHVLTSDNELKFLGNDIISTIDIYSLTGSKVIGEKVSSNTVNVSNLASGVYIYRATTKQGQPIQSKFIKK